VVCSCTSSIHGEGRERAGEDDRKHKRRREGERERKLLLRSK